MPRNAVKRFLSSWLDDSIEGTKNSLWLQRHHNDAGMAMCSICPKPSFFNVRMGYKSVRQHFGTAKHQENLKNCQRDPTFKQGSKPGVEQLNGNIVDGLAAMREMEARQVKNTEKTLRSQVQYVASAMYHNSSGYMVDCHADMFPHLFPCEPTKIWDLRKTKYTYFGTHGLYPYFHGKIVKAMQSHPFSLNFDESTVNGCTQLDVNVGHIAEDNLVARKMFTSIELHEGTSADEITASILTSLEKKRIDPKMTVNATTDGCKVMLGVIQGVQAQLREAIPTLPKWGGCPGHDGCNILKSATKALDPSLTQIYPALFGCLSKHSAHKKRKFEQVEEWVGLAIRKVPKFLDVRFRVIERLAFWMESQDRAIYEYFDEMRENILLGKYVASETEMVVLEKYLGHYVEVRLSNCFIIEVCKPIIDMINFFESDKVRVQYRHEKMVLVLHDYLSKFMKNAGMGNNNDVDGKQLLKVNFTDRQQHLSNTDIWLGSKVENLLEEMGLSRTSDEIKPWIEKVRDFYEEAVSKMIKYWKEGIQSKSLRALSILDPKLWKTATLDHSKKQWRILGEKFSNVIDTDELPHLISEVAKAKLKTTDGDDWCKDECEPDEFFAWLHTKEDVNGSKEFPLLSKLGLSMCTIYNSGSAAERDFSTMNDTITEKKNRTSQLLLETKLSIKDEIRRLARKCKKCKVLKSKGQKSSHCHCSQWSPPEDLMETMRGGGPWKRYKLEIEEKAKLKKDEEVLRQLLFDEDLKKSKKDMKKEVQKLKKRRREEQREIEEEDEAARREERQKKKKSSLFTAPESPGGKRKKVKSKAAEKREEQQMRLKK